MARPRTNNIPSDILHLVAAIQLANGFCVGSDTRKWPTGFLLQVNELAKLVKSIGNDNTTIGDISRMYLDSRRFYLDEITK